MRLLKILVLLVSTSLVIYHTIPDKWLENNEEDRDTWYHTVEDEVVTYYKSINKPIPTMVVLKDGITKRIEFKELFLWTRD